MSSSLNDLSKTGAMAHELAEAASRWELDRLKFLEQIQAPNRIQLAFITIYQNLKLYRPFIPEAVLQFNNKKSDSAEEDDEDHIEVCCWSEVPAMRNSCESIEVVHFAREGRALDPSEECPKGDLKWPKICSFCLKEPHLYRNAVFRAVWLEI